jgi:hypothetical protein
VCVFKLTGCADVVHLKMEIKYCCRIIIGKTMPNIQYRDSPTSHACRVCGKKSRKVFIEKFRENTWKFKLVYIIYDS